jgi:hypothetical protein
VIRNFAELFALWTPLQLSRLLDIPYRTAVSMYQRGAIGPGHWARIIEISKARGEPITADMLIAFRDEKRARPPSPIEPSRQNRRDCFKSKPRTTTIVNSS